MPNKTSTRIIAKEHPSLMNAVRRAMINCCPCYAPADELSLEDIKILTEVFRIPNIREKFLVLSLNFANLLTMTNRLQRLPFLTFMEGSNIENDYTNLYFSFCGRTPQEPFENTDAMVRRVYLKDIKVFRVERGGGGAAGGGEIRYVDITDELGNYVDLANGYGDILVAKLNRGQSLHSFFRVVKGIGYKDSKWQPCCFRYRFIPKSEEPDHRFIEKPDYIVNHKKDIDFDKDTGMCNIEITIEYNGKMSTSDVLKRTIENLVKQFEHFNELYTSVETAGFDSIMRREVSPIETKEILSLSCKDQEGEDLYKMGLGDHGFCNLFVCTLISILLERGTKIDSFFAAYRITHPLDRKVLLTVDLPKIMDRAALYRDVSKTAIERLERVAISGRQQREEISEGKGEEEPW